MRYAAVLSHQTAYDTDISWRAWGHGERPIAADWSVIACVIATVGEECVEIALRIAALISGIATAGGLLVAIFVYKRQTNAQVFMEYTRRYEEIMREIPTHARAARTNSSAALPSSSDDLTYQILRYLNLCSEEFYLRKRGYLAAEIWGIWERELLRTLATPLLRREWSMLRAEFNSYPEFQAYVDAAQKGAFASSIELAT